MIERGISVEDVVRALSAPKPGSVRESVNATGRWEVWGEAAAGFRLEKQPQTVVITVVKSDEGKHTP
jgi:hypothetical protein